MIDCLFTIDTNEERKEKLPSDYFTVTIHVESERRANNGGKQNTNDLYRGDGGTVSPPKTCVVPRSLWQSNT